MLYGVLMPRQESSTPLVKPAGWFMTILLILVAWIIQKVSMH